MARQASALATVAALALLAVHGAHAQRSDTKPPSPSDVANYRTVKIADGVYAFIAPDGITPIVNGNSVLIIGDDGALVVDTGQFSSVTKWEIAQIKSLTSQPVRYIVNTHWHPDHWLGNGEFQAAFPGVKIVSAPSTRELMMTQALPFIDPKQAERTRDAVQRMLASGKRGDGSLVGDDAKLHYGYVLGQLEELIPELERVKPVYPT